MPVKWFAGILLFVSVSLCGFAGGFTYADASTPRQIPLCMIGDSITWAMNGDFWRLYLVERIPNLAFVGTHVAMHGYSHAGEGGNSTSAVLKRMDQIPACPFYHLLIGTNDDGAANEGNAQKTAEATAGRIQEIVGLLLKKPGVEKVFLGSLMPCSTKNPWRDKTNSIVNTILREQFDKAFPDGRVVWVEYEKPVRAIQGWEPLIELHPTKEGYKIIADILAAKLKDTLKERVSDKAPAAKDGAGVRVENLWDAQAACTSVPVIAGWYTVSFDLLDVSAEKPVLRVSSVGQVKEPLAQSFTLNPAGKGTRVAVQLFTKYESYGYTRSKLSIEPQGCKIDRILFEKSRPSWKASVYGEGSYVDTESQVSPGELIEFKR